MTRDQLEKMHAGRRRAEERRRRDHREVVKTYKSWVKTEARAYAALVRAREIYGMDSDEAQTAYDDWRFALSGIPRMSTLPSDATYRELSGEHC